MENKEPDQSCGRPWNCRGLEKEPRRDCLQFHFKLCVCLMFSALAVSTSEAMFFNHSLPSVLCSEWWRSSEVQNKGWQAAKRFEKSLHLKACSSKSSWMFGPVWIHIFTLDNQGHVKKKKDFTVRLLFFWINSEMSGLGEVSTPFTSLCECIGHFLINRCTQIPSGVRGRCAACAEVLYILWF